MRKMIAALGLTLVLAPAAQAANVAGVKLADSIAVNGQNLALNGAALRKKLFIKVYVGGLYLASKQSNPQAILASDAPRQMTMNFVYDVDKAKIVEAWEEGLAANTPNASAEVKNAFKTLGSWMEDMKEGQSLQLTYVPNKGTTVTVNGKVKGTLPGKATADAILATWIGPKPGPGEDFKKGLLGK